MEWEFFRGIIDTLTGQPVLLAGFVGLSSLLQQWFPPFPSDTVLLLCGLLSCPEPVLGCILYGIYLLCTLFSSWSVYELGLRKGPAILASRPFKKLFPPEKWQMIGSKLGKFDVAALLLFKFVPGCNTIALLFAGMFRLDRVRVYASGGMAAFLQNTIMFSLGRKIGDNVPLLRSLMARWNVVAIGLAVLSIGGFFLMSKMLKKRS
jgi:membrane protein DedA with SNARE-associated domain